MLPDSVGKTAGNRDSYRLKQHRRNVLAVLINLLRRSGVDSQQRHFLFVQGTVGAALPTCEYSAQTPA